MQRIHDIDVEISRLRNETLGTSNDASLSDRREPGDACLLFFNTRWRVDRGLIAMDPGARTQGRFTVDHQQGVTTTARGGYTHSGKGKTVEPQPGVNTLFHPGALSAMPAGSAVQPSLSSSSLGNPAVSLSSRPRLADGSRATLRGSLEDRSDFHFHGLERERFRRRPRNSGTGPRGGHQCMEVRRHLYRPRQSTTTIAAERMESADCGRCCHRFIRRAIASLRI